MKKILLLLLISHLSLLTSSAQPEIVWLQPGQTAEGTTYYLPKTALRLTLTIEKTVYTPGDFARYAERYLKVADVRQSAETSHRVIAYSLTSVGVRDTSKCFSFRLKGKSETDETVINSDGILLAVNAAPMDYGDGYSDHSRLATTSQKIATPHSNPSEKRNPEPKAISYLSAEVLAAGSTAKKAELIARQILDLREQRQLLITGEADEMPQDERQLQLMLREIDEQSRSLTALFTGTTQCDTTVTTVIYCPDKEVERDVVFRLSRRLGVVDADDLSGTPYYISIKDQNPAIQEMPDDPKAQAKLLKERSKKQKGFYVNVPGMAQVTLYQGDHLLDTYDVPLAQFGTVELRDGDLFKRYLTHMQLHPATGAVVTLTSDAR